MDDVLNNYVLFFKDQVSEMLIEYRRLLKVPIKQLIAEGLVQYAVVHGVSDSRGHVVLKLDKKYSPRLKVLKSLVLIKRAAREQWGEKPVVWNCSFEEFLCKEEFHTSSSSVQPLYYLKSENPQEVLLGCGAVSSRMFRKIKNAITDRVKIHVLLYDTEPPTRYLANLADYIQRNPADGVLRSFPKISYDSWSPTLLAYDPHDSNLISRSLLSALSDRHKVVLQGPPGTGKSFAAAQIVADYMDQGKSVCVTAMANKALMELVDQPPLEKFLKDGRMSKTMLTSDEEAHAPGLKDADSDFVAPKGEALLGTYYKISNQFRHLEPATARPLYDLVVVEEASQAYLTTLAAALRLGRDVLIVGDPMQLAPIVVSEGKPEYKRWNAVIQVDGLSALVLGNDVASFRITTTFRLTQASAVLTGTFYGGTLRSVSPHRLDWSSLGERYFPSEGGVVLDVLRGGEDGVLSSAAVAVIGDVLGKIRSSHEGASVAIITPFKDSAKAIQRHFLFEGNGLDVSIETIDRVQGATVDYAILYFPLRSVPFAFNERRFNVATSRSRSTTLILSDYELLDMRSITGKVREFLQKVKGVYHTQLSAERAIEDAQAITMLEERDLPPTLAEVQTLLDNVDVFLSHWLQVNLKPIYGNRMWSDGVVAKLTDLQRENVLDDGAQAFYDLDFASLITVFTANFRELKRHLHLKQELINIARQMKDIRVAYAHKNAKTIVMPNVKTIQYHMDTTEQFLLGLGTNSLNVAVAVEKLKANLTASTAKT